LGQSPRISTKPPFAIAEAIGQALGVPVKSRSEAEAKDHFGPLAFIVGVDNPVSNTFTKRGLRWTPIQPGLLADLKSRTSSRE
jgi:hypothetical protein